MPQVLISVGRLCVQHVNHTYGRTGTLWHGCYESSLVQAETYLLLCHRYVELNPVRAGMVADPALYRWSSCRTNALGELDVLLTPHPLYLGLGDDEDARRAGGGRAEPRPRRREPRRPARPGEGAQQPRGYLQRARAPTGGLGACRRGGQHLRALAAENPDVLPDLASALNNLGRRNSERSRAEEIDELWSAALAAIPWQVDRGFLLLRRAESSPLGGPAAIGDPKARDQPAK